METITFLFPGHAHAPRGGNKVIYEYANRLATDGYEVHIVYAGSIFWSRKNLRFKLSGIVRYVQQLCSGYSCHRWFALDWHIKEHYALSLNYRHVPKSDLYVCTSPHTAMYLNDYPIENTNKFYFIQDYENWGDVTDRKLRATYHFPMQKIVISKWLKRIMDEEGVECQLVLNGFNFEYFKMSMSIEQKDKYQIAMMNQSMARKGCKYGFEALDIVKQKYPQLKVSLFGVQSRPEFLPEWYDYYQSPDKETHNRIYNESAIFLGTSIQEGWGLTIGEAMMCGSAVACTDNLGHLEMAIDGVNALVSPICDSDSLANNIIRLIKDDSLRCRIAENGNKHIRYFNIDSSYMQLKQSLNLE